MDESYEQLLGRAFDELPHLSTESVDFKIPKVDSIIQGSKTIVRNFSEIVKAARREGREIVRYLTKELAVPVNIEQDRLMISGRIDQETLNAKIEKYFATYVICKECHKPDTRIEASEHGFVTIVCEACGARYTIKNY
ncbi:MAG: translation initiation factor IF-2 subunit beta [Candidatus Micrarchaeaceae archaeon]